MRPVLRRVGVALLPVFLGVAARAQSKPAAVTAHRLTSLNGLQLSNARAEVTTYRGRKSVRLLPLTGADRSATGNAQAQTLLAIVDGTDFSDGTIELDVAGAPRPDADTSSRGFVGLAFRVDSGVAHYESFYLRPTNGRAEDQLRRNHSTQYVSFPDYPWERLRRESPGKYESYVDLDAGAWTRMRIEVRGTTARLFVNGATQPVLVVNDLKLGAVRGKIGLWSNVDTDAYFSNLKVR